MSSSLEPRGNMSHRRVEGVSVQAVSSSSQKSTLYHDDGRPAYPRHEGKGRCPQGTRNQSRLSLILLSCLFLMSRVDGFAGVGSVCHQSRLLMAADNNDDEEDGEDAGIVFEDLSWRVAKLRLEEANTRRFLKAKPRYLPYDECRKWVQAWSRWNSQKDWEDWIEMGEKRNAYIPARPAEYYGRLGQWISWEHFLSVDKRNDKEESRFD